VHRDDIMRFLSVTKSSNLQFDSDDSGLLSRLQVLLLNQNSRGKPSTFAQRLLDLLIVHPLYASTKRVCLTRRFGIANQIQVDSVGSITDKANLMSEGYSCFVNADGSLFRLRPSEIRTFFDSQLVLKSFVDRELPIQRSIQYIAEMGLKSGICLALPYHGMTAGFLFINGDDTALVEQDPSHYCLLSYVQTIATLALIESGMPSDSYYLLADGERGAYQGDFFDIDKMAQITQRHLDLMGHRAEILKFEGHAPRAIVSHGNIANLITRFAAIQGLKRLSLQVGVEGQAIRWELTWDGQNAAGLNSILLNSIIKDFKAFSIPIELNKDRLSFSTTLDAGMVSREVTYSVA
jgi:hypothetical protein